jgi:hypothetical protein
MLNNMRHFNQDFGRSPIAGEDYDPDKISSQDDYDYLTDGPIFCQECGADLSSGHYAICSQWEM